VPSLLRPGRRSPPPFSVIDSHPVHVCRLVRVQDRQRLDGLAQTGYCAAHKTYFHGVREHLIFTPQGRIAFVIQVPGNRHDVHGLYALLKTGFAGALLGDCAYQPNPSKDLKLRAQGIHMHAAQKANAKHPRPQFLRRWLHRRRSPVERRIGLFNTQFSAQRTLNRSARHYLARRWTKALAHNCSRHINGKLKLRVESVAPLHAVA